MDLAEAGRGALKAWIDRWQSQSDPRWTKLAAHIRRTYSREEVLSTGEHQVATVAGDVRQLLPVLRSVNRSN
jgi:hypothetical protein